MAKTISIFNNKGGVGKTTYMYHVAHLLAEDGSNVLVVDCDSQCNLTAYCLSDESIELSWAADGNSIFRNIEPVYETIGDICDRPPSRVLNARGNIHIVPGDLRLSDFEDRLGNTWNSAKGGSLPDIRAQSAIHRYIRWAAEHVAADIVMIDLGPNLGALNRAVLASSDYFITPVAPDLFSIQGTENLGNKLVTWRTEWDQVNQAIGESRLSIPAGRPKYLGYVIQQHNIRSNAEGMTKGWGIYNGRLKPAITSNIVDKLRPSDQAVLWEDDDYHLGQIPNLHSLIPYSMDARKPIFYCTSKDGLKGSHITKAKEASGHFEEMVALLQQVVEDEF
ncbi:ParA family protein [Camelimonas lactis]|uniref:ParA family protein n=1 Tax=Camelimonas lactis TaxID=659006 RepID=UPI001050C671|nr:ParA family protein [Camelimonas lactis]